MQIREFVVDGLGHLSTLIADESAGVAAVVDPRRDVDAYLDAARDAGWRISHVIETHLHNDYVSGGRELVAATGATHVIGSGAELRHEHRPVADREAFDVGALRFTSLHTPGHTPEHMAYAVADRSRADEPLLMFTGGSLLVGAVGRTDLLGAANAVPWANDMYRTLRDVVLPHDDFVTIRPTHGAGSLCSTGIASTPSSTIGFERRHNPMVRPIVDAADVELFVRTLLGPQPAFPRYFARMRPTNQAGPPLLGTRIPDPIALEVDAVRRRLADGALVVDLRAPAAFAVGHVPGSVSIPAGASFGTWLGWVVEPDRPLVLLLDRPEDWDDAIRQARRIGYEAIIGHLRGGFGAWAGAGEPVAAHGRLTIAQLADRVAAGGPEAPLVIDVRQVSEFAAGHVPGSHHLACGDLAGRLAELPAGRPIVAICASGYRASVAASLLDQAGFADVSWVAEGVPAWEASGRPVDRGEPRQTESPGPDSASGASHGHHHDAGPANH